jgi:phosphatidylglycerophosphate synthase
LKGWRPGPLVDGGPALRIAAAPRGAFRATRTIRLLPERSTETVEPRILVAAAFVGLGAAVAGAVAWTIVVVVTDFELGIVAWAIGFAAGWAVALAAQGRRGTALQVVAVVAALIGILLGKYGTFAYEVREVVEDEAGAEAVPAYWDRDLVDFFIEELDNVFGVFDLLWVGFAVFTAWRLLRPEPPAPPAEAA